MKKIILSLLIIFNMQALAMPLNVAITVDDLPAHMNLPAGISRLDVAKKMLSALQKHHIKSVYGFINGGKIKDSRDNYAVLHLWVDSGQLLGNHTYDHVNYNKVSANIYIKQIKMNEPDLMKLMPNKNYHYFRYPYLYEGNTQDKRDKTRQFLFDNHYQIAQVTMDFQDYLWNNAYVRCLNKHDNQAIAWLKMSYIEQAIHAITVAHTLSMAVFHRDINNILLLHIGVFDALMLDDLLTAYEKQGVTFISLADALQDDVYKINSNLVSENTGSFLEQMAHAKNIAVPNTVEVLMDDIPIKKLLNLCRKA